MSFEILALISAVALLGPLIASRHSWHLPVVLGELLAGLVIGTSGFRWLDPGDPALAFFAAIGFALVMFVAGTDIPIANAAIRPALVAGAVRAAIVGVVAAAAGFGIAGVFGTGHAALYAVLIASSSAVVVLPLVDAIGLTGTPVLQTLAQVGVVADIACIVALPLVINPAQAAHAALGAAAVAGSAALFYVLLKASDKRGWLHKLHKESKHLSFALELRINLVMLFLLSALAVTHRFLGHAGRFRARVGDRRRGRTTAPGKTVVLDHRGILRAAVLRLAWRIAEPARAGGPPITDIARSSARYRCSARALRELAVRPALAVGSR